MKFKHLFILLIVSVLLLGSMNPALAAKDDKLIHINVLLNTEITDDILAELGTYGKVMGKIVQIDALTMKIKQSQLSDIQGLEYVDAANPDAERKGIPIDTVAAEDFSAGLSTWNLDAINVTDFGFNNRQVAEDGTGVYVAVLDTGLLGTWRQYFPQERISEEYAISFGGGGNDHGFIPDQPNKWEKDTNSHGTHVTSTILGYSFYGTSINGVAPMATIIPVKVLNQNGSGWSSVVAAGIMYVAHLKEGPLAGSPVVINMSLGGPELDDIEKAAIDYAIDKGVIIVASAGNKGMEGMGYPGAYEPVISVAASGWDQEWYTTPPNTSWWWYLNVAEPTDPNHFYITDFSSRELPGQDLDIAAPGSWVVGPYQLQMGQTSYYYLGGTSMASPHVAGIVALMAEKYPALAALQAETILEGSAIGLAPGCRFILTPWGTVEYCWGADATGAGLVDAVEALAATP
jgi:subtilisin family serine protease